MGKVLPFRRPAAVQQRPRVSAVEELMAAQIRLVCAWAGLVNPMWWAFGPLAAARCGSREDRPRDQAIPIRSSLRRL